MPETPADAESRRRAEEASRAQTDAAANQPATAAVVRAAGKRPAKALLLRS